MAWLGLLADGRRMTKAFCRFALACLLAMPCGEILADSKVPSPRLFGGLPLDIAIKDVRGNGTRMLASFEDPNCIYCRQLAKELADMTDVTIYTFPYPILSASSKNISVAIWCSSDRSRAWNAWMASRAAPKAPSCDADDIDKVMALGKSMNIRSVPTIFLANGERYTGGKSRFELEMAISSPKVMVFQSDIRNKPN